MKIKFHGAARTVTGSQHLLEINGKSLLLDCGLFQGKREESYKRNKNLLFDPQKINAVILSHAHIDHSGNLPSLWRNGFKGNIYVTPATIDLCEIMLRDSGYIQEKDIEYVNKKRRKKNEPEFNPLYTIDDVINTLNLFKPVNYYEELEIPEFDGKVKMKFFNAGHILGSAQTVLEINQNTRKIKFAFTGDIGRPGLPILRDPDFIGNVNCIISESTYGNRVHDKSDGMEFQFAKTINETYNKSGKLIIPAFSVGRTQEIVYVYTKLLNEGKIPDVKIFVDSPLSTNATEVFRKHPDSFDKETAKLLRNGVDIFGNTHVSYIRDAFYSKKLNELDEPVIIISASGMCESGRILHHLKNNIENKNNTILIVGFMAQHTLGRQIIDSRDKPNPTVKIFGDSYQVNANVVVLNSFSAHADKNELHEYFDKFDRKLLEDIFLVHGELPQQQALKSALEKMGFGKIYIPSDGEEFEI